MNLNDWNISNLDPMEFGRTFNKTLHAEEFGFRVIEFNEPLQPGDTLSMRFKYDIVADGFTENQPKNEIVKNGTCLMLTSFNSKYFPVLGYNVNNELLRDTERADFDVAHQ